MALTTTTRNFPDYSLILPYPANLDKIDTIFAGLSQRVSKNSLLSTKNTQNTKKKAKNFVFLCVLRGFYPGQTQVLPIFRQPVSNYPPKLGCFTVQSWCTMCL